METFTSTTFDKRAKDLLLEWHVPGISLAVVDGSDIASKGFGHASIEPWKPCTPDTLFDIASCSKSLTAASVALLIADDENYPHVQWDSNMCDLLPDDFVMSKKEYTRGITIEDVLSHRTGLPSHDSSYLGLNAEYPDSAESVTRNLRNLEINAPIRSKWQYCNMMFTVATHLIEKLTGMAFEEYLHSNFFRPLGMKSSNLLPSAAKRAGLGGRLATPYSWDRASQTYKTLTWPEDPGAQGAGSIATCVNDYIKYVKTIMNQEGPFTLDVYNGLVTPRIFASAPWFEQGVLDNDPYTSWTAYAAGWEVYFYRGHQVVRHDGAISGFTSVHFFLPQFKFGGVFVGNSNDAGTVAEILMKELIDEVVGVPKNDRLDWNAYIKDREAKADKKEEERKGDTREELLRDRQPQSQSLPLNTYTGQYWNAGYRGMKLDVKDGQLFIDATDRSMGFTLLFEHVHSQTHYIARLVDHHDYTDQDEIKAEFRVEDDKAIRMGLHLEPDLENLIWFDKVGSSEVLTRR